MACNDIDTGPIVDPRRLVGTLVVLAVAAYPWWLAAKWIVGKVLGYF